MAQKYNTQQSFLAVNVLFVNERGQIALLLRESTRWMNNYYTIPGGKVEIGEPFLGAAVREIKEEVGVDLMPEDLTHAVTLHICPDKNDDDMRWLHVIFVASKWQGELYNAEPHVHAELLWCDPEKLPDNMIPSLKAGVEAWLKKEGYVEYDW